MRLLGMVVFALACAILAACANTTGGTSTMPGGQLPQLQPPTTPTGAPTATPAFAQGLVRVGDGKPVTLSAPGDYKVTAVFPESTASPPVMLNATVSVPGPGGIPAYGATLKKGFLFEKHRELGPVLVYVWFNSDKNVTLSALPQLDFAIPLTVLEPYGTDPVLKLAIYDPAKENKWTEGVAHRVEVTPTPVPSGSSAAASATASATPTPTPTPTLTPTPTPSPTPSSPRPPGSPATPPPPATPPGAPGAPGALPSAPATQKPPVQTMTVRFVPEARPMKLLAKKNFVFVLYALPAPTESPSPSGSASAKASASPGASAAASASPSASGSPAASASPSATPSVAPSPSGT